MSDTPDTPNVGSSPWVGSTGFPAHPAAPVGGGGPGNFVTGNQITGAPGNDGGAVPHPLSPTGRNLLLVQNHVDALNEDGVALDLNVPVSDTDKPNPPPKTKVQTITGASRSNTYEEIKVTIKVLADGVGTKGANRAYLEIGLSGSPVTPPIMETDEENVEARTVTSFGKVVGKTVVKDPLGKNKFTATLTMQLFYGPGMDTSDKSAYGRGTTPDDIDKKNTSIGFHESRHLEHAIDYFKDSSKLPAIFSSKFGEKVVDFQAAQNTWAKSFQTWIDAEATQSIANVDEVGNTPMSQYSGHKH